MSSGKDSIDCRGGCIHVCADRWRCRKRLPEPLAGLSGTSSLLGAAGDDTLMVAGAATQWFADAGDGADSLSIAGAVQRTTVLAGDGADTLQIGSMSQDLHCQRAAAMTPLLLQVLRLPARCVQVSEMT